MRVMIAFNGDFVMNKNRMNKNTKITKPRTDIVLSEFNPTLLNTITTQWYAKRTNPQPKMKEVTGKISFFPEISNTYLHK